MYYCITVILTCSDYYFLLLTCSVLLTRSLLLLTHSVLLTCSVLLYYCIIDLLSVTVYVYIYEESFVNSYSSNLTFYIH